MKTLIAILLVASFLQNTIWSVDLVLIILICRSYIKPGRDNLWLAFSFGLINGLLSLNILGIQSLIYLVLIIITESLSRTRLSGNLLIIPLSFVLLLLNQVLSIFLHQPFQFSSKIFIEAVFSLPVLYLIKLWEERFITHKEIRLKL